MVVLNRVSARSTTYGGTVNRPTLPLSTRAKKLGIAAVAASMALGLGACSSDADVASRNLSNAADNFEVQRRIIFYNGITGDYVLEVIGLCSVGNDRTADELSITCKTGPSEFKKHFLGRSDNVTWFAEQIESKGVGTDRYQVNFKPSVILPDVKLR